jgi:hypothetical protein
MPSTHHIFSLLTLHIKLRLRIITLLHYTFHYVTFQGLLTIIIESNQSKPIIEQILL